MKRIYFTVTNDLVYDQRMKRICTTMAENGYDVVLVGRKRKTSPPLQHSPYKQRRLNCWFDKGKRFYVEYNLRLFLFLLFKRMDAICAIDLDTIYPCLLVSRFKKVKRVYDAHEFFTEMKEVITRPRIQKFWTKVEKSTVPKYTNGYTVSDGLAVEFKKRYHVDYRTIRNLPVLKPFTDTYAPMKFILFQGAVNEARGFENLIPAMKQIPYKLVICGDGNFMSQLKQLIAENKVQDKVEIKGMLLPDQLWDIAQKATIGVGFPESGGINQFFALSNKFFDYIHAGLPQIAVNYPEYKKINDQYDIAVLVNDIEINTIVSSINNLMGNDVLLGKLKQNCLKAREELNWQHEQKKLLEFYHQLFTI